MAESLIEGLLGGGEPEETAEPEAPANTPDPAAAAMAIDAAKHDPALADEAASYFRKQARLVDIQTEHLHEQRAVQLSHLKLRRFSDRLKAATQVFIILVASVIGLGVLVMLSDAFSSRSVVVNVFKAPSALASRGLTGDVVASGVLDTLQKLQAATRSIDKGLNTKSAWASDVKIEVPETGVSIGEIDRLLHERFGHDLHIDGDLVQTDTGGLALTVRGDGVPANTFTGGAGDLDKLTTAAAEYVYGRSQPVQYATYLTNADRNKDALAFLPGAFSRAPDADRARLAYVWGRTYIGLYQPGPADAKFRLEMALTRRGSAQWWRAWGDVVGDVALARGEEAAWRESQAMLKAAAEAPRSARPEVAELQNPALVTWDLPLYLAANLQEAGRNNGNGAGLVIESPLVADTYALMHDPAQSARYLAASDPEDATTKAQALLLEGYADLNRSDAAAAILPLEAFYRAWLADPNLQLTYNDNACFLGFAYGSVGRMSDAEAVFKRAPAWSRCFALHGDVLAHAGDEAGAERVWAEGLKVGPDLPNVYLHRGVFELGHGDLRAAAADLSTASTKAPHFADPLKAWGDLLAKEGRWKDALTKYDEALKYAPAWAELRLARDAAARKA